MANFSCKKAFYSNYLKKILFIRKECWLVSEREIIKLYFYSVNWNKKGLIILNYFFLKERCSFLEGVYSFGPLVHKQKKIFKWRKKRYITLGNYLFLPLLHILLVLNLRILLVLLHHTPVLLHHTPVLLLHTPVLLLHTPVLLLHKPH